MGLQEKKSKTDIARLIQSVSTVCRELKCNGNGRGGYSYLKADINTQKRRHRSPGNRATDKSVLWRVKELITDKQWFPDQISGALGEEGIRISHTTIYKLIHDDPSGQLASFCRNKLKYTRRNRHVHVTKATNMKDRVSIHEMPMEADGKRFGDWEMDTIVGKDNKGAILTLTERSTNLLLMARLKHGKNAKEAARTAWRLLLPYKGEGVKTILTDNGCEFAAHKELTRLIGATVYFTDAYSLWQKGAIENANKLIRQYIPKGVDFNTITDKKK